VAVTKVTRHFQVTIPKAIREVIGIEEGTLLRFAIEDGRIVLIPQKLVDAPPKRSARPGGSRGL